MPPSLKRRHYAIHGVGAIWLSESAFPGTRPDGHRV